MIAVPPLIREGIRKILESKTYIKIVAEASTHQEIFPLVEKKKSDVLFLDTIICDLNILKLLQSIGGKNPKTKVVLLTHTQNEEAIAADAISLCVQGYLTAASDATHLIHAIRAASKDKIRAEKKITSGLIRLLPAERGKLGFLESRPIKGRGEHKTRVISAIK